MNTNHGIGGMALLIIIPLLIVILMIGSAINNVKNYDRVELIREFEIIKIEPPKRLYISLREVNTGEIYSDIYVGKRCYGWEERIILHDKINLVKIIKTHKKTGESTYYVDVSKLCYGN